MPEIIKDDAGDLPALADTGIVADEETTAPPVGQKLAMRLAGVDNGFELRQGQQALVDDVYGKIWCVGRGRRIDRRHGCGLHQRAGVILGARDGQALRSVRLKDRVGQLSFALILDLVDGVYA